MSILQLLRFSVLLTTSYTFGISDYPSDASFCSDSLWNSCVGRCGRKPTTTTCACDRKCELFGDCCADFRTECHVTTDTGMTRNLGGFSCVDGVLVIDKCAPWWPADETVQRESCVRIGPSSYTDDHDVLTFRNVHCARCNGYDDTIHLPISKDVRRCSYHVGSCPESSPRNISERCSAYSDPVFGDDGSTRIYKNVHCVICNENSLYHAQCPTPTRNFMSNLRPFPPLNEDIPASFTILFNFNANGKMQTMFNSQKTDIWSSTKANCQDLEIWEPFSKKCRRIYCSSQFQLVGFKCIKVYDNSTIGRGTDVDVANLTEAARMLWQNSSRVCVTLYVQLDQKMSDEVSEKLHVYFLRQLAQDLDASLHRFSNFTLTYNVTGDPNSTEYVLDAAVSFILDEQPPPDVAGTSVEPLSEPTIERIVSSLSNAISLSHLFMHVLDITLHVIGIAEEFVPPDLSLNSSDTNDSTTAALKSWCDTDTGARTLLYENNDFVAVFVANDSNNDDNNNGNVAMDIHIPATNLTYHPSEYLASLVFQGDQWQKDANLSGYVVVCDRSSTGNDCVRIAISKTDYVLLPNASLLYEGSEDLPSVIDVDLYELLPDGTALVCYNLPPDQDGTTVLYDPAAFGNEAFGERLLNAVLTGLSLTASLITFVTYLAFDDLRTLPGVCVMNLTACLWFFQFVFMIGERQSIAEFHPSVCRTIAAFVHFTSLCYFSWMNIVAIDLYRVFASSKSLFKSMGRSRQSVAVWYFLYAYGIPTVLVGSCVIADFISFESGAEYGTHGYCWIGNRTVLLLTFVLPAFMQLTSNVVLYVIVAVAINRFRRSTKLATSDIHGQHSMSTAVLYIRLCTVLGFTWLLGMFVVLPFKSTTVEAVLRYVFIVLNASHGTAIFLAFVCNRKVLLKYVNILRTLYEELQVIELRAWPQRKASIRCDACHGKVNRTPSNETYRSTLSSCD